MPTASDVGTETPARPAFLLYNSSSSQKRLPVYPLEESPPLDTPKQTPSIEDEIKQLRAKAAALIAEAQNLLDKAFQITTEVARNHSPQVVDAKREWVDKSEK